MYLDKEQIKEYLPHRDPILLLDSAVISDNSTEAVKYISPDLSLFSGHFPGHPVLPGAYLVESLAQAAALLLLTLPGNTGKTPYLADIRRMHFLRQTAPGSTITLKAALTESAGNGLYECSVSAYLEEDRLAAGVFMMALR